MASTVHSDLSQLEKLDIPATLETLRSRYARDDIYTNCGEILIAVNPYKRLGIFGPDQHDHYDWKKFEASAPPHIFNVAARAYRHMRETKTNQVILVSGESGAGKTESTKLMVKHFVHMCPHDTGDLHEKVIEVNPLLEAFGNAQTIMNDNSSRFAKFLELSFEENGQVLGAVVRDYMLEKSRVVNYSYAEGNFHIFYSLFAGSSPEQMSELELKEAKDYKIMTYGSPELLKQTDKYQKMYKEQMSVLRQIGFDDEDMSILHSMLGAIIHLTEVKFKEADKQNEALEILNIDHVNTAARLLGVNAMDLCVALIKTKTDYGGEQIHCLKTLDQAREGRDALAKAIYERLFGWIIRSVNEDLNPTKQRMRIAATIGILDIAGFENLQHNSFEQLCINFVNERLQNFMNENVFKTEKAIYEEEGIPCTDVNFTNSMDIITLFTEKTGVFNLLDQETKLQFGTDKKFVDLLTTNNSESPLIIKCVSDDPEFGIKHFAGPVTYKCEGFLEKNKDTVNDDLLDCMKGSENGFIQDLFIVQKGPTGTISETQFNLRRSTRAASRTTKGKPQTDNSRKLAEDLKNQGYKSNPSSEMLASYSPKKHNTVISYFRASMDKLLEKMKYAKAHFVRCIKPNNQKMKDNFNSTKVKDQLVYNGITEIAKIRKMGYPVRKKHIDFYKRYSVLHPGFSKQRVDNPKQSAHTLMEKIFPGNFRGSYKIGKYQVFLKEHAHLFLEKCLYIREKAARKSLQENIMKLLSKKKAEKELKEKRKRDEAFQLTKDFERHQKEDGEKIEKENAEKVSSAASSYISSTMGSTIGSPQGSSSSDTSSERDPFSNLSRTRKPGGGTIPITSPSNNSEQTAPKVISGKEKAPPTSKRPSPSKQEPEQPLPQRKNDKEFWDIFANIPREQKSKDVHERGSLRFIKIITYVLLFLLVCVSLVFQKISLMLLVNKQDRNFTKIKNVKDLLSDSDKKFKKDEAVYNSARYLLLVLAICIPYVLTVLISLLKVLFGNLSVPSKKTVFVSVYMECAHSVGLSLLVFKYLGDMHSARGIMVLSATCILPSIVKPFFAKEDKSGSSRICKRMSVFVADLVAIIIQISVIPIILNLGFLVEHEDPRSDIGTVVEVVFCLLLCSFSWWENFLDDRPFSKNCRLQQWILEIKFDLQAGRSIITFVTYSFKIGITIIMAFFYRDGLDLNVSAVSETLTKDRYENLLPSAFYEHYNYIMDYTSIICLTLGSYVAYYIAYTVCKLQMQIVSYSVASLLSTPVAVGIVVLDCYYDILGPFTKEELNCFNEKSYDVEHWYHFLIGVLWLMSTYWIARYIWFPNQERLAKVDRLYVNPLYCSILLEQHLLMNRKRHNRHIKRDFVNNERNSEAPATPVFRLSKDESRQANGEDRSNFQKIPPMIYACATMWHENRLEMVQILKSLYRVDHDQFVRKMAVEIAQNEIEENDSDELINPEQYEYYEFQTHIMFDDAFEFDDEEDRVPNSFVKLFMEVMQEAANAIHHKAIKLVPPVKIPSPYGAQLVFQLPGENMMYVHLKDKNKIRHRKRWSQVMYMYYLLGYRIINECQERVLNALETDTFNDLATWDTENIHGTVGKSQIFNILGDEVIYRAENTFILALDGDVDFTPKAIRLLIDRMQKNELLGAACGRIHPIGKAVCISCRKELTRKELDEDIYEECSPKVKDTSIQCMEHLIERQNTIEEQADVNTHETCQMEFDGSNIFSDSETIEQQSTQAIEKSMKNVRYRIKVVDNMTTKPKNVDRVIPSISSYSNFTFERNGIRVWKAYNIGQGPMVWYQKFEYAVAHWLQKSTEHVLGCVLCSPGCFSLFRGSALMDDNIMRKYTIKPTEASHHLMYDQGEDRWLCTLLLQQGYRVDYAAASDAYTYAPEGFGEFFNQRRRWMPSTMANIMDLLADAKNTVAINNNISWLYMVYQAALMVSTLIGPATVIMMIAGSYRTVFKLALLTSYAIALTPAILYWILCFTVKPKYQILAAEIFSALYSFIMMVVFVGSIITAVEESPYHPSVIFLCAMVFIFLFAAVLHPWEFSCIFHGILYFLCVPSGFLLLVIYSLCNMNVVSWGTREVPKKKTKAEIAEEEKKKNEKEEKKKQGWFSRLMPKVQFQDLKGLVDFTKKEDKNIELLERMNKNMERLLGSKNEDEQTEFLIDKSKTSKPKKSVSFATSMKEESETEDTEEEEYVYQREKKTRDDLINPKWLEVEEFKSGITFEMNIEETKFWQSFIEKYLKPLDANKDEQKKTTKELAELRNNVTAGFAFINLIWIAINFMFQLRQPAIITFPIANGESLTEENKNNIKIGALGLMFVVFFVAILLIQFIGMVVHRWGTFLHLIAITEILDQKTTKNSKDKIRKAKDLIHICKEIAAEPMPDYPSDDEDSNRQKKETEHLKEKINNLSMHGVAENLKDTQNKGIGRSLRDTRKLGNSIGASRFRNTMNDDNFKRESVKILARSKRMVHEEEPSFKPNVLRHRRVAKFGSPAPAQSHLLEKIQERKLNTKVVGMDRSTAGNLESTYRQTDSFQEDDEPLYDEIPGAGTLSRAFHKKIQKMKKTGVRPSENNGSRRYDGNFEMRSTPSPQDQSRL